MLDGPTQGGGAELGGLPSLKRERYDNSLAPSESCPVWSSVGRLYGDPRPQPHLITAISPSALMAVARRAPR